MRIRECGQLLGFTKIGFKNKHDCLFCGRETHWRSGVHFDHEKLCSWCNFAYEPGPDCPVCGYYTIYTEKWKSSFRCLHHKCRADVRVERRGNVNNNRIVEHENNASV